MKISFESGNKASLEVKFSVRSGEEIEFIP